MTQAEETAANVPAAVKAAIPLITTDGLEACEVLDDNRMLFTLYADVPDAHGQIRTMAGQFVMPLPGVVRGVVMVLMKLPDYCLMKVMRMLRRSAARQLH